MRRERLLPESRRAERALISARRVRLLDRRQDHRRVGGRSLPVLGFGLFGKNLVNVWAIVLGVYLYARFPFDRQRVELRFLNARAASDRIVYVLDRRQPTEAQSRRSALSASAELIGSAQAASPAHAETFDGGALASPAAFADLTQWRPIGASERRDTLVTPSALGDLRRLALKAPRELSGFVATFELERRTAAVLVKMMLPMLLMTIIMYATLHFPAALTKEKVTVAVTAALSGAVLLSSVNTQLGGVGYTILAEFAFYAFFALGLLCILYVTVFEALRLNGRTTQAARVEIITRGVFLASVAAMIGAAALLA